jgi:hypothetical protein
VAPDPWDDQVAAEIATDDAPALCQHCLAPHDQLADFCAECGAPVGECTNLMPFPCLFSIGHILRIGTNGEYRRSPLTISGFILLSIVEYLVFAPFYLFEFFRHLPGRPETALANPSGPNGGAVPQP